METKNNGSTSQPHKKMTAKKIIMYVILAIILSVGGFYGYKEYSYYTTHVVTEDAQTDGNITPVRARISGYITKVLVKDNQHVVKGQVIARIDTTDEAIKVRMAKSELSSAKASLEVAIASENQAKVLLDKAQLDFKRASELYKGGATTRQKYDDTKTALDAAQATYDESEKKVAQVRVQINQQQDQLDFAKLQLSYTNIVAPETGKISNKHVEAGQLVQSGQPVMAVTDTRSYWVTANFKETELEHIKVGQAVKISVDAYPGMVYPGRVESIAGATGAKYALLPPENATGNFVKVVQRVPVKIVLTDYKVEHPLQLGLNVTASIDYTQPIPREYTADVQLH
jgi:membrane fusion protein (multidrug efflux system)